MAKRKNNVVKKIGDSASLLSKPKSILRRKDFKELGKVRISRSFLPKLTR